MKTITLFSLVSVDITSSKFIAIMFLESCDILQGDKVSIFNTKSFSERFIYLAVNLSQDHIVPIQFKLGRLSDI